MKKIIILQILTLVSYCTHAQWNSPGGGNTYTNDYVTIGSTSGNGKFSVFNPEANHPAGLFSYTGGGANSFGIYPYLDGNTYLQHDGNLFFSPLYSVTPQLVINTSGNVGVGTSNTPAKLTVNTTGGSSSLTGAGTIADFTANMGGDRARLTIGNVSAASTSAAILFYGQNSGNTALENKWEIGTDLNSNHGRDMYFYNTNINNVQMFLQGDGNVAIGTMDSKGYKLAVNGSAIATSVTVKSFGSWPDYVFKPTYALPPLSAIKSYIDKNQHLPDMPSEQEVAKDGINLGEMNKLLVKKVEELTLYLIEKDEELKRQNIKNTNLEKRIAEIENKLKKEQEN